MMADAIEHELMFIESDECGFGVNCIIGGEKRVRVV